MAAKKVTLGKITYQKNSDNTYYVTWSFSEKHVDHYEVEWGYATGNGVWFRESVKNETYKQSTYSPPSNATKITVNVKPVSTTYSKNVETVKNGKKTTTKKTVSYWTGTWANSKFNAAAITIDGKTSPIPVPNAPDISITGTKLTAHVDYTPTDTHKVDAIEFQVIKNDKSSAGKATGTLKYDSASVTIDIALGGEYKVRCRALKNYTSTTMVVVPSGQIAAAKGYDQAALDQALADQNATMTNYLMMLNAVNTSSTEYSDWSDYSSEEGTQPKAVEGDLAVKATSSTQVKLTWTKVSGATGYEIEYTKNKSYFGKSSSEVQSDSLESTATTRYISGLETGTTWYFRIRATNDKGNSTWSTIAECVLGATPTAPTTWTYTSTATIGETVVLNWTHNSSDGSDQAGAEVEYQINNGDKSTETITGTTAKYSLKLTADKFNDGDVVKWRVRTKGITDKFSSWSTQRQFTVYSVPAVTITLNQLGGTVYNYPLKIDIEAVVSSQKATSIDMRIVSLESYEGFVDGTGTPAMITTGTELFYHLYEPEDNLVQTELGPGDCRLEYGKTYRIQVTAAFDSGLTAENSYDFVLGYLLYEDYDVYATVAIDNGSLIAYITPSCTNVGSGEESGPEAENVTMSVYRREYNGDLVLVADNIPGGGNTTIVDPHPALDYARYRIVASDNDNGRITYTDLPDVEIGYGSIIIQWEEAWKYFDFDPMEQPDEPTWSGSMLDLPYDIDISIDSDPEVSLVEYIGREHPVSYYGTQKGETARWSCNIPKTDKETLYQIRRLQAYAGDVYVREPSGIGYWANVTVTYSISHKDTVVPVTFSIKRVEGGI